jgi:hypothetical protein
MGSLDSWDFCSSSCLFIIWGEQSILDNCGSESIDKALSGSRNRLLSDGSKWRVGGRQGVD